MENSGIYLIQNSVSGHVYVGQSISIKKRLLHHKNHLRHHNHANQHLQRAWDKYGEDSFNFRILELVDVELLDAREKYFLDFYKQSCAVYNIATPGKAPMLGRKMSEETRAKISKALMGKIPSRESIEKTARANRGLKRSDATKAKLSDSHGKKVEQVSMTTGNVLRVYKSGFATQKDGFNFRCVSNCCLGKQVKHKGFFWRFADVKGV